MTVFPPSMPLIRTICLGLVIIMTGCVSQPEEEEASEMTRSELVERELLRRLANTPAPNGRSATRRSSAGLTAPTQRRLTPHPSRSNRFSRPVQPSDPVQPTQPSTESDALRSYPLSMIERRSILSDVVIPADEREASLQSPGVRVTMIGMLLPLSGLYARVAGQMKLAAQIALFRSQNPNVMLIFADTQGTPQGSAKATKDILARGADVIVGPLLSGSIVAAKQIAWPMGVPMVTLGNSIALAQRGLYMAGFTVRPEIKALVRYAYDQDMRKVALLGPDSRYGQEVLQALQDAIGEVNLEHSRDPPKRQRRPSASSSERPFSPDENPEDDSPQDEILISPVMALTRLQLVSNNDDADWRPVLHVLSNYDERRRLYLNTVARLEKAIEETNNPIDIEGREKLEQRDTLGTIPFDVLIVAISEPYALQSVMGQLAALDLTMPDVLVMGMRPWDSILEIRNDPSFNGAVYAALPGSLRQAFAHQFDQLSNQTPHSLASVAFEAMATVLKALEETQNGRGMPLLEALENPRGFVGIESIVRLESSGESNRAMEIKRIENGSVQVIQPSATRFPSTANRVN